MNKKKDRKEMIRYRMKQLKDNIKAYRDMIYPLQRELDFINGNYEKTWEEEYDVESTVITDSKSGVKRGK